MLSEDGIDLRLGTRSSGSTADDGGWVVRTSDGDVGAPQLIVATGYEGAPFMPDWSGREAFEGQAPACVASTGIPGRSRAARCWWSAPAARGWRSHTTSRREEPSNVWLSVRTPPNIILREGPGKFPGDVLAVALLHLPVRFADAVARAGRRADLGDLSEYGLPVPEEGVFARLHRLGVAPAIVDREVIDAIKARRIEVVRGVESLDRNGAQLADGARVEPDAIVCATGYRRGLEPLVGHLGVLGERGLPRALGARPAAHGLRFVGYVSRPGGLGYMAKEAKRAAKAIARESRPAPVRR